MNSKKQVLGGAMLSYVLIIFNALYGILITPFVISGLGIAEYGVYKTIASLSSSLMILDLGLGGTMTRYIANYRAKKQQKEIPNFLAMMCFETAVVLLIVSLGCWAAYSSLDALYAQSFTVQQLNLAKDLFLIFSINMLLHIVENLLGGIITGYNDFVFSNSAKFLRLLLRAGLILLLLSRGIDAVGLVLLDLALTIGFIVVEGLWCVFRYQLKIRLEHWDKTLLLETLKYTALMFVTTLINQANSNLDNILIGAIVGASAVTVYSVGLTFYGMFEHLSISISGVLLPSISHLLEEDDGMEKAKNLVVKAGRVQFILLAGACAGFFLLGKEFLGLWVGPGFEDAYIVALILMIPSIFTLCVNGMISILRAKNLLGVRTAILFGSTCLNAVITLFGTRYYGYFAAAIGTSFSLIVGVIIGINIYYQRKLKVNMFRLYIAIVGKAWLPLLLATAVCWISKTYVLGGWGAFILNVVIFCSVYGLGLCAFALTKQQRASLIRKIGLIRR